MRIVLAISFVAAMAASGCASRDTMRALQSPAPAPQGVVRFEPDHAYRDAVAIEWIGGVSRQSYVFAEPNQRVVRSVLASALRDSGLYAGTNVRSHYGLRVAVSEADGPVVGGNFNSEFAATYAIVDRRSGQEIWRRDIRTPGTGYFLSFNETDWQTAWFIDPVVAAVEVGNPFNFVGFASNGAADRAERQGLYGDHNRARSERLGPERAARANYAAVATNVNAFLLAFAEDNHVDILPVLPCYGSPEVEARKVEILASGGNFATDNCRVRR